MREVVHWEMVFREGCWMEGEVRLGCPCLVEERWFPGLLRGGYCKLGVCGACVED